MLAPLENNMWYTYIIKGNKDGRWYTGITDDLRKRLSKHNSGKVPSTKDRRPFDLIYYEACVSQDDAVAREKYLKSGKRFLFSNGVSVVPGA